MPARRARAPREAEDDGALLEASEGGGRRGPVNLEAIFILLQQDLGVEGGELQQPFGACVSPPWTQRCVGLIQPADMTLHELSNGKQDCKGGTGSMTGGRGRGQ